MVYIVAGRMLTWLYYSELKITSELLKEAFEKEFCVNQCLAACRKLVQEIATGFVIKEPILIHPVPQVYEFGNFMS